MASEERRSRFGSSLFSCARGQRDDSSLLDSLEHQLRLKTLENDELKKGNAELKKWKDSFMTMVEKFESTMILQNCKYVTIGDVNMADETMDAQKLDMYMETVTKALNSAAEDRVRSENNAQWLKETLENVENKMNVMEAHFSDLNATLTRDFAKAAKQLMQHNVDIADQFSNLRKIFQRVQSNRINETGERENNKKIEAGINSIRDWLGLTADVTSSTLPVPAKKLLKMLTDTYGKVPVKLEMLFTSRSKGYYESTDTFDNNVARWLVGWVRSGTENTAGVLRRELIDLNRRVDVVSDSEG